MTIWRDLIKDLNNVGIGNVIPPSMKEMQRLDKYMWSAPTTKKAYISKLKSAGYVTPDDVIVKEIPENISSMDPLRTVSKVTNLSEGFLKVIRHCNGTSGLVTLVGIGDLLPEVSAQSLIRYLDRLEHKGYISKHWRRFEYRVNREKGLIPEDLRVTDPIDYAARRESWLDR